MNDGVYQEELNNDTLCKVVGIGLYSETLAIGDICGYLKIYTYQ